MRAFWPIYWIRGGLGDRRPTTATAFFLRAVLANGRLETTTVPTVRPQIPFRRQRIGGRIPKLQECVHATCKVTDGQVDTARNRILRLGADGEPEYIRATACGPSGRRPGGRSSPWSFGHAPRQNEGYWVVEGGSIFNQAGLCTSELVMVTLPGLSPGEVAVS